MLLLAGCVSAHLDTTSSPPAAEAKPAAIDVPSGPDTVVAQIGTEKVTLGELDHAVSGRLSQLQRQRAEQEHRIRQAGLDEIINRKLLTREATRRGMPEGVLLKTEVEDKTPPVTDGEIKTFYDANARRMPGPYHQVKGRLREHLQQEKRQRRFREYVETLRSAARVEIALPPAAAPRIHLEATGTARGPFTARVTIVMFSDFQCPFCAKAAPVIEQLVRAYPDEVRIVYRDFPLSMHDKAQKAAEAGRCAEERGEFWELHDLIFAHQDRMAIGDLKRYARQIGLDSAAFDACLDSGQMAQRVKQDLDAGEKAGVDGTPAFFIDGLMLSGAQPFDAFTRLVDAELARARR